MKPHNEVAQLSAAAINQLLIDCECQNREEAAALCGLLIAAGIRIMRRNVGRPMASMLLADILLKMARMPDDLPGAAPTEAPPSATRH